jgi:hypothetical protein
MTATEAAAARQAILAAALAEEAEDAAYERMVAAIGDDVITSDDAPYR